MSDNCLSAGGLSEMTYIGTQTLATELPQKSKTGACDSSPANLDCFPADLEPCARVSVGGPAELRVEATVHHPKAICRASLAFTAWDSSWLVSRKGCTSFHLQDLQKPQERGWAFSAMDKLTSPFFVPLHFLHPLPPGVWPAKLTLTALWCVSHCFGHLLWHHKMPPKLIAHNSSAASALSSVDQEYEQGTAGSSLPHILQLRQQGGQQASRLCSAGTPALLPRCSLPAGFLHCLLCGSPCSLLGLLHNLMVLGSWISYMALPLVRTLKQQLKA